MNVKDVTVLSLCLAALVGLGCEDETAKKGKFTQEEMAKFPFADRENLPVPSGGLTLSVKDETVTIDEIVTPVMQVYKPPSGTEADLFRLRVRPIVREAVIGKIADVLLYQEAKKQAPENIDDVLETAVEKEVKKFLSGYGNDYAEAQKELTDRGMDWEKFREFQKKLLLTQSYYASQHLMEDEPISHSEMLALYKAMQADDFQFKGLLRRQDVMWDGFVQFRLIDIVCEKVVLDEIDIVAGRTQRQAALARAVALLVEIDTGEDFAELVKEYSNDAEHRVAEGGLWTPVTEGSKLRAPYDVVEQKAWQMEIGEVAGPVESPGHVFLIKLEDKKVGGVASFEALQPKIELDIQLLRRRERFDKLINKLIVQANIASLEPFVDVCVERAWDRWQAEQGLTSK
jgi:parvulin-like peptidyl-prolyl isomerase